MTGPFAAVPARLFRVTALAAAVSALGLAVAAKTLAVASEPGRALEWSGVPLTDIHGAAVDGEALAGRVVLLVNTASRCAFTPQYEGLEALHDRYGGLGLTVLGVPSNDFGGQEPGSNADIAQFCSATYDVSFTMLEKASVVGSDAHPLFAWARKAGGREAVPGWNFHKVLIGRDGKFVAGFPSYVSPRSPQVMGAVETALRATGL